MFQSIKIRKDLFVHRIGTFKIIITGFKQVALNPFEMSLKIRF